MMSFVVLIVAWEQWPFGLCCMQTAAENNGLWTGCFKNFEKATVMVRPKSEHLLEIHGNTTLKNWFHPKRLSMTSQNVFKEHPSCSCLPSNLYSFNIYTVDTGCYKLTP